MNTATTSDTLREQRHILFGVPIHAVRIGEAADVVFNWIDADEFKCRYVVTPNVDHVVKLYSNERMRSAYAGASLVVADGWPVIAASRLLRRPLPERVAGSDLVPFLFSLSALRRPLRVYLLGAAPGVAEAARANIERQWPSVRVCGTSAPPMGFDALHAENERVLAGIAAARPDLLVVGLGAPKQELWLHRFSDRIEAKVAIAAGGTIDFLAGEQRRAALWVRRIGMEWLYRLASDPRRLARRYSYDAWVFPQLLVRECFRR